MSGKFNMDDYVDVAERIREFSKRYPEGSLQSTLTRHDDGWLCRAEAYRHPDDAKPGVGHAFEPVPGKTPYTKDSEAMNAETSAWGRAIVALGFETKKIASTQEVRARQSKNTPPPEPRSGAAAMALGKIRGKYAREEIASVGVQLFPGRSLASLSEDEVGELRAGLEQLRLEVAS